MEELKITIYTKNKNGETKIIHTKWDKNDPSYELDALHEGLLQLIRETNVAISETNDKFSELRKKKGYEVD
jgi:hypothetical protein